jgi:hypothetical protein
MARRLRAEWRAEWRERLVQFRSWMGTAGKFCRREGISQSSLLRGANRLRVCQRAPQNRPLRGGPNPAKGLLRIRAGIRSFCNKTPLTKRAVGGT